MQTNATANDEFREQLSAWHDGALPDEASRFVLKRLLADDALRSELGRWQAIGDVLRRERQQRPTSNLAARVTAVLDAEAAAAISQATGDGTAARRANSRPGRAPAIRWVASAAAVGVAAVLMWPSSGPAPQPSSPAIAAAPVDTVLRATPGPRRETPAPLVAVAAREPGTAIAGVPPLMRAPQPTPEQLAPLPAVDAPSKPWPRSAQGDAAYVVDYAPAGAPPRQ